MPGPKRTAVLIELFANNAEARLAALCWPLVPRGLKGPRMLRAWSKCSGIPVTRLEFFADMLRMHGICLADRSIDPEAIPLLEHMAAEVLRSKKRGRA